MKIYTKGGDAGETSLFGGARVPKDDQRIAAYGTFDELNALLGLAVAEGGLPGPVSGALQRIQGELFQLGAELATPRGKATKAAKIGPSETEAMEKLIDQLEASLTPLKTFILPGGTRAAALLHLARTVSRRAERALITLHRAEPQRPEVLQFVNRLSDLLFVCARAANAQAQIADTPWVSP